MRTVAILLAAVMSLTNTGAFAQVAKKPIRLAALCFSKGEQTSGLNKICYYDCLGSMVAINVKNFELCPVTINR